VSELRVIGRQRLNGQIADTNTLADVIIQTAVKCLKEHLIPKAIIETAAKNDNRGRQWLKGSQGEGKLAFQNFEDALKRSVKSEEKRAIATKILAWMGDDIPFVALKPLFEDFVPVAETPPPGVVFWMINKHEAIEKYKKAIREIKAEIGLYIEYSDEAIALQLGKPGDWWEKERGNLYD